MDIKATNIGNDFNYLENILKRQEKWRQKQIDTYYRRGRPIFLHGEYCKSRFVKLN